MSDETQRIEMENGTVITGGGSKIRGHSADRMFIDVSPEEAAWAIAEVRKRIPDISDEDALDIMYERWSNFPVDQGDEREGG